MTALARNPQDVLDFWFGTLDPSGLADSRIKKQWFMGGKAFDQQIRDEFEADIRAALTGMLDHWAREPAYSVALIVILDQFCRNVFRGTAQAFSGDHQAIIQSKNLLGHPDVSALPASYRFFAYMPLMHSEEAKDHDLLLTKVDQELSLADHIEITDFWQGMRTSALEHADIVRTYGRYPYRNGVLGRESTPDELSYLEQNAGRFGQ